MAETLRFAPRHEHVFLGADHDRHERRTWIVVGLTLVTMIVEIVAGTLFGSMALVADGWHMSTHAAALGIAGFAYSFARRHAHDRRFTFGTGKLGDLAAFASALVLMLVALFIAWESVIRLASPVAIGFNQALVVAVLGLGVNLASALILKEDHHGHGHERGHEHGHSHGGRDRHDAHDHRHEDHGHPQALHRGADNNLRAAYLHVLADAFTSVLAIGALVGGSLYGWIWLDPAMGLIGALVIAHWSISLIRRSGAVLLDAVPDAALVDAIKERMDAAGAEVADLHLWQVGPGHYGAIVSVVAVEAAAPAAYKAHLAALPQLAHLTVEVNAAA
ncbi:CDF family Co(II)/Ni(II) efflux transporter DmeF [Bosea sp. (in: a-proteobacteria)]